MMSVGNILRTVSYGVVFLVALIVFAIPGVIVALLPESLRFKCTFIYKIEHFVFWLFIKSWWVPVSYEGMANIPKHTRCVFIGNHRSSIDAPLLGMVARGEPHVFLFINWLAQYPIFGFVIRRLEVMVDPSAPRKAVSAIEQAVDRATKLHGHVLLFPEGGRYTDDGVRDFFTGFAIIAQQTGYPVVPVMIRNSDKVMPPKSLWVHWAPITVTIGEPFTYNQGEDKGAFTARVRTWFLEQQEL
ncbi:1-acyl-sn-glycerol-3-phosphate acyltransferase [Candidatus Babeliales bacterium]|nr:1-acyl-sn-glycerol-3-phosphate acyltransferase [Candidatus Babeliales bacterium]